MTTTDAPGATRLAPRPTFRSPDLSGWRLPDVSDNVLDNGLRLLNMPLPGRGIAAVRLFLQAPLEHEGRDGIHALLCALLTDGTRGLDGTELTLALTRCGASVGASAGARGIILHIDAAVPRLRAALELAADILQQPRLDSQDISRRLAEGQADWAGMQWDPSRRAEHELQSLLYPQGHRLGRPLDGTPQTLAGVTREELLAAHERILAAPAASVVVVGDLQDMDVPELIGSVFGDLPLGGGDASVASWQPAPVTTRTVSQPDTVQTVLRWARVANNVDQSGRLLAVLAAVALGGGMDSRFNHVLRQEAGHTYGVQSSLDGVDTDAVAFTVSTSVDETATRESVEAVERIIAEALADGFTAQEVEDARRQMLSRRLLGMTTSSDFAGSVLDLVIHERPLSDFDTWTSIITNATAESVTEALRAVLPDGRLSRVAVGSPAALATLEPDHDGLAGSQSATPAATPAGTSAGDPPAERSSTASGRRVTLTATGTSAGADDGGTAFVAELTMRIAAGWHCYPPGSEEGIALSVSALGDARVDKFELLGPAPAHLEGTTTLTVRGWIPGSGSPRLVVRVQACNGQTCEMPEKVEVTVPLRE